MLVGQEVLGPQQNKINYLQDNFYGECGGLKDIL